MSDKKDFFDAIKREALKAEIVALQRDKDDDKAIRKLLDAFPLEDIDKLDVDIRQRSVATAIDRLIRNIIMQWNRRVDEDFEREPFTEAELAGIEDKYRDRDGDRNNIYSAYGSTLIAVVRTPECWFGIRIGDGKCVAIYEDGAVEDPIPWDPQCFLNVTTSICDSKAFANFRHCFHVTRFPVAIYVGTDGVDDSYGDDERLFAFYKSLTSVFAEKGFEAGKAELRGFLPKLTQKGSGDDISISAIFDMESVGRWNVAELAKAKAEAETKAKAEKAAAEAAAKVVEETTKAAELAKAKAAEAERAMEEAAKAAAEAKAKAAEAEKAAAEASKALDANSIVNNPDAQEEETVVTPT
jgi:hypothetical protein